jgi:uncharacterized protein (DUF952 family)
MSSDASQHLRRLVFKICRERDWQDALQTGRYLGSGDDLRDGFIHLSAAGQLAGTAARHFKDQPGLVLVALDAAMLGPALRWEVSRGGALFPHHYAPIEVAAAVWVKPVPLGPDGLPQLPPDIGPC